MRRTAYLTFQKAWLSLTGIFLSLGIAAQSKDSLEALLQSSLPDTQRLSVLWQLCQLGSNNVDAPFAYQYCTKTFELAQRLEDTARIVEAHNTMAITFLRSESSVAKYRYHIQLAMSWAEHFSDPMLLARMLWSVGILHTLEVDSLIKNDLPVDGAVVTKAKEAFEKSANIFEKAGEPMWAAQSMAKIGDLYNLQGKADQSLPFYLAFYEKAAQHGTSQQLMTASIQVGSGYHTLGGRKNLLKALDFLKKSRTNGAAGWLPARTTLLRRSY